MSLLDRRITSVLLKGEASPMAVKISRGSSGFCPLVFLHGLGDSSDAFREAFRSPSLIEHSLITIDLAGHGLSAKAEHNSYSVNGQIKNIICILVQLQLDQFHLIGHSFGGSLAIVLAGCAKSCRSVVSVEGHISNSDNTILELAAGACREGSISHWFEHKFREGAVKTAMGLYRPLERYYKSLQSCDPVAFGEGASSLLDFMHPRDNIWSRIGTKFERLTIPKLFVFGDLSLAASAADEIKARNVTNLRFEKCFHWPMIERPEEFYASLASFVREKPG